jgi:hypothetical protein
LAVLLLRWRRSIGAFNGKKAKLSPGQTKNTPAGCVFDGYDKIFAVFNEKLVLTVFSLPKMCSNFAIG